MKARYQFMLYSSGEFSTARRPNAEPWDPIGSSQVMIEYLNSMGHSISLEELEFSVSEDLYKIIPRFFLHGSKSKGETHPGKRCKGPAYCWHATKHELPNGADLFVVVSPNIYFVFSATEIKTPYQFKILEDAMIDELEYIEEEQIEAEEEDWEENPPIPNAMPAALQWGMWALHTAGMFLSNPPGTRIIEELTGSYHGQEDLTLNAYGPKGELLGYISYSEFPSGSNKIHVNWMYVADKMRRRGVGTLLVLALQDKYKKINWGYTTFGGTKLLEKIEKLKKQKMAFIPGGKQNQLRRAKKPGKKAPVAKATPNRYTRKKKR